MQIFARLRHNTVEIGKYTKFKAVFWAVGYWLTVPYQKLMGLGGGDVEGLLNERLFTSFPGITQRCYILTKYSFHISFQKITI